MLNTVTDAEGEAIVRHGNERVLRARFNDARFFWNTDQKLTLKDRVSHAQVGHLPEGTGQLL